MTIRYDQALTIDDIAQKMGRAKQTIHNRYIGDIKLHCTHWKIGKQLKVEKNDFEKYLKSFATKAKIN